MCLLIDLIASKPHDHSAKLAHAVPFKVTVDISSPDILEQIASYMPESQLHLHSCNNELVNPALLEKAERLRSIWMDWRGKGCREQDSLRGRKSFPKLEFIWMSMGSLRNPSKSAAKSALLHTECDRSMLSRKILQFKMDIYTFVWGDVPGNGNIMNLHCASILKLYITELLVP